MGEPEQLVDRSGMAVELEVGPTNGRMPVGIVAADAFVMATTGTAAAGSAAHSKVQTARLQECDGPCNHSRVEWNGLGWAE